jgi:predicted PurR-regulated permease PerM
VTPHDGSTRTLSSWVTFAGCVLVVTVLYWAQVVLVPIALAGLLTFMLAPLVTRLQRGIGRIAAVIVVVTCGSAILGGGAWAAFTQFSRVVADLPAYRTNIRQKIADVRHAGQGGSLEKVQATFDDIKTEIQRPDPREPVRGTAARPIVVRSEQVADWWSFPAWLGPIVGPVATGGFVLVLVIFMLLEREDLRGRVIGLIGHGHLAVTTRAFEEASERVSRQLLMQALVNAIYGACVAIGLWALGVPYALFWAVVGASLRFIPYVGPVLASGAPILVSLAVLPGWTQPLSVIGLFVALELFTNLVLETVLYAGAAGVSQVGLLVAIAFWTWLWGPIGLLLATPLTVCVVVLGKHVPALEFLSTLMADMPALAPDVAYYQRLLARDQNDAFERIERHQAAEGRETVYDALLLPALNYAERDRLEGRLSPAEEDMVIGATRELLTDSNSPERPPPTDAAEATERSVEADEMGAATPRPMPLPVLAYPVNGDADAVALRMLDQLIDGDAIDLEIVTTVMMSSELIATLRQQASRVLCLADLPPSPSSKTRYLVKKLRAAIPELTIVVGRWAPDALADDNLRLLTDAGATHVTTRLLETRDVLRQYISVPHSENDGTAIGFPSSGLTKGS